MNGRMQSRKLWTLIGMTALNLFNGLLSNPIEPERLSGVTKLAGIYLGAQGIADGLGGFLGKKG